MFLPVLIIYSASLGGIISQDYQTKATEAECWARTNEMQKEVLSFDSEKDIEHIYKDCIPINVKNVPS